MKRNFATFLSDFPDDSQENARGDIVVPDGRSILSAIGNEIPGSSDPTQHSFYGWKIEFSCRSGRRAWALLQFVGPWLLIVEARTGWFDGARKKESAIEEAVRLIREAMSNVEGIHNVNWQTKGEFSRRNDHF